MIEIPQWLDKGIFMVLGILHSLPLAYFAHHKTWLVLGLAYTNTLASMLLISRIRRGKKYSLKETLKNLFSRSS